ncbi:MAG: ribosomal protein 60S [Candidatus Parvarchaeum acidophilus ARMAN-5]|jgi:large subunit ribosomal protein L12|uniref:Large ribosomal subunit protein P1 n=1 Tax=Candidatus Parvarchaeum acidophilus ARMAN-5 TaxID=662762 RepID=D6GVC7_PARA5|nr:MAG: ribosomal protein 60S [Candidatus Parvarchaeum acidophilus ARMAN-5]
MEYVYAAMLLNSFGKEITEDSLKKVVSAVGVEPDEAQIKVVVSALKDVDIAKIIEEAKNTQVAQAPAAEEKKEAKKAEPKEEVKSADEAAAGLSSLFG